MTPRASIIIVTYGQRALTEQCLRSLERCLGDRLGREYELVLVDNNSPDDTPTMLKSWSDRAVVTLLPENRNFAGGCNVGARAASGEVLVFLNNDTEVAPGALETLAEQALEPGVSVAGCRLLFPDATVQHAGVAFLRSTGLGGAAMGQHVFHDQSPELPATRGTYELDCVTGACIAVRAQTFRAVDGFDEGFINGLEDVDLCLRIRVQGERIVYRGDVTIVHHEGASRGRGAQLWATPERMQAMRSNDLLFTGRWAQSLDQDDELAATAWGAVLEDQPPARIPSGADLVVAGQPAGIGPGADEARAFVAALAAVGRQVAAADAPHPNVTARLTSPLATVIDQARRRVPVPGARWVLVPSGERDALVVEASTVVRLGRSRTQTPVTHQTAVWASSPALAVELVTAGLRGGQIHVVAPPVLPTPLGPGGGGLLATLPAHAPARARLVLDALKRLPAHTRLRLLPTVAVRGLADAVSDALPHAELLKPVCDDGRFAKLAADADVVIGLGDDDPFERRALVGAGAGAATVTVPDGPAHAVLGELGATLPTLAAAPLAAVLGQTLERSGEDRAQRAAAVAEACGPERLAEHLRDAFPALSAAA